MAISKRQGYDLTISNNGKQKHIGLYDTAQEAEVAFQSLTGRKAAHTPSEAQASSSMRKHSSKYRGVYWNKQKEKWCAKIKKNQKAYWLGYFKNELAAAIVYDDVAKNLFGDYARLNCIEYNLFDK